MWDCEHCGCRAIAGPITSCPMCREEREMPKSTTGGPSNAWAAAEAQPEELAVVPEVAESEPEPVVLKAELQDQARELGLPVSGTKAQLADAVASAVVPAPAPPRAPVLATATVVTRTAPAADTED